MVNVRLVENRVNSHVGSVIVVKVASHSNEPGMIVRMKKTNLARPAKNEDPVSTSPACVEMAESTIVEPGVPRQEIGVDAV
jgi:uncharacterized protein YggE